MSRLALCRCEGCGRMVSREGYCRSHFISEHMGWTIGAEDLRRVPLGRLTDAQLDALRMRTHGQRSIEAILEACFSIMEEAEWTSHRDAAMDALEQDLNGGLAPYLSTTDPLEPEPSPMGEGWEWRGREFVYVGDR